MKVPIMKTINRIHRNGASKRTGSQAKIQPAKPIKATAVQEPVGLMFFSDEDGSLDNGVVDLYPAEFVAIEQDAAARGENLAAWLIRTLDETPALRALHSTAQRPAPPETIAAHAKTSHDEKQVRIVVVDEEGEKITIFGILESQHRAMTADAKALGISLQQLFEKIMVASFSNTRSQRKGLEAEVAA
jgi:hypothetical protein